MAPDRNQDAAPYLRPWKNGRPEAAGALMGGCVENGLLVFKILTDVCFYMAMFMPLFLSGPLWVRVLLFLALASWCVWLLICWKKRNHGGAGP